MQTESLLVEWCDLATSLLCGEQTGLDSRLVQLEAPKSRKWSWGRVAGDTTRTFSGLMFWESLLVNGSWIVIFAGLLNSCAVISCAQVGYPRLFVVGDNSCVMPSQVDLRHCWRVVANRFLVH